MNRYIISVLIIILVYACSPQKRLARLVRKHPELMGTIHLTLHDTIRFKDTIIKTIEVPVPGFRDTFDLDGRDTVINTELLEVAYKKGQLSVHVKDRKIFVHDTIYIDTTIYPTYETDVPIIVNTPEKPKQSWWNKLGEKVKDFIAFSFVIFVIYGLYKFFNGLRKPS